MFEKGNKNEGLVGKMTDRNKAFEKRFLTGNVVWGKDNRTNVVREKRFMKMLIKKMAFGTCLIGTKAF